MKEVDEISLTHWRADGTATSRRDLVVREEPLEIRVAGTPISVTMRTPGADEELAAGFLLTEGIVEKGDDLRRVSPASDRPDCNIVDAELAPHVEVDFARLTRHVFASSSCGLCGKATIESVRQQFPAVRSALTIAPHTIVGLPEKLREAQASFDRTGGLHAAALFDARGDLSCCREDVGRHNAVDKVLGRALMDGEIPLREHLLLVSGRASFEIMQKALAAGIPVIAAVSAPSSLAIQFARENDQTLIGFLRGQTMNVYSGEGRLRRTDASDD